MRIALLLVALSMAALALQQPPSQGAQAPRDQGAPTAAPSGTASLAGFVTVLANGQSSPLRRARVTLQSDTGAPAETTDTDTEGRYRLEHLAQGTYRITIDKPGFVPLGRLVPIAIRAAQAATSNIQMIHSAAMEGRVTTPDGEPVSGFTVSAVRLGYGPYGKKSIAIRQAVTDDRGHFRVHTLAAGEYYLEAAPDAIRLAGSAQAPPGSLRPLRGYYPGTPRLNDAGVVVLAAGQEADNLDFPITISALSTVAGRVVLSSGQTPATIGVRLQRVGAPQGEVVCFSLGQFSAAQGPGAQFQCSNVPPGDFWVLVAARATPTAVPEFFAATLAVTGQPMSTVTVTTGPGTPIAGRVEVEGGAPLPRDLQITALETEYELPSAAPQGPPSSAPPAPPPGIVGADGTFAFPAVFGPRLIRPTRLPDGWAVKSVWLDDTEITDIPTTFAAIDKPRAVRVVLTTAVGSISGAVTDQSNRPAGGARVVVFSEDQKHWGARSRFIKTVEAGPDGRYAITGLLPGRYHVVAVDVLDEGTWEDPDVLGKLQTYGGARVVVGTEKLDVNLKRVGGGA